MSEPSKRRCLGRRRSCGTTAASSDGVVELSHQRHTARQAARTRLIHPAPRSLDEVLRVPMECVHRLLRYSDWSLQPGIRAELLQACERGIILTTSFSGTGGVEAVAHAVMNEVANALGVKPPRVVCYSASDNAPEARRMLLGHDGPGKPRHVFGNLLDRLPANVRADLIALQEKKLQLWKDTKLEQKEENLTDTEVRNVQTRLACELVAGVQEILRKTTFERKAYCYAHRKHCFISPMSDPELDLMLWMEVAGSACTAFSQAGLRAGWLHESALIYLSWLFSIRFFSPDILLHECVKFFPPAALAEVLNDPAVQVKCDFSLTAGPEGDDDDESDMDGEMISPVDEVDDQRGTSNTFVQELAGPKWNTQSYVFGPTDLGIPAARARRYSICVRSGSAVFMPGAEFGEAFFAPLISTGKIYLDVELEDSGAADCDDFLADNLSSSDIARLEGWHLLCAKRGLCDSDFRNWKTPFAVASITQTAEWQGVGQSTANHVMPTILRRTRLWDLVGEKPIGLHTHWLIMGFAHPRVKLQSVSADVRNLCSPLSSTIPSLSLVEQRSLTGNMMHSSAFAAAFLYAIGCTSKFAS